MTQKNSCLDCGSPLGETYNCETCQAFCKRQVVAKVMAAMEKVDYHSMTLFEELAEKISVTPPKPPRTVTEFVQKFMVNNGDNFYTPTENRFKTHAEAVKDYNGKWNQNRKDDSGRGGVVWKGPGQDDYVPDSSCCGALECDHPTHEAPHSQMFHYLELPYGHICDCCGGSMVAIIQLDILGGVLKTLLIDCG